MAILVKFAVQDMTAETYEAVLDRLQAAGASAPPGRLYHVSYGSADALQVIELYDSPVSLEEFGKALVPILMEMGVEAEPEVLPVFNIIES